MRIQVTRNTKMLEETVPAYLHRCVHVLHHCDFKLIIMTAALRWNNYAIDLVQSNSFVKLNRPFPNSLPPLFRSLSGRSLFWFILKEDIIIITQILHVGLLWKRVWGELKNCPFIKCHTKNMKYTFEYFYIFLSPGHKTSKGGSSNLKWKMEAGLIYCKVRFYANSQKESTMRVNSLDQ